MVTCDEIETAIRSLPKEIYLTQYGNEYGIGTLAKRTEKPTVEDNAKVFDLNRINLAVEEIPQYFKMMRNIPRDTSSYGLKHYLEDKVDENFKRDGYITNGDFIIAMMLCGYVCKFPRIAGGYGVNARLNAKRK